MVVPNESRIWVAIPLIHFDLCCAGALNITEIKFIVNILTKKHHCILSWKIFAVLP